MALLPALRALRFLSRAQLPPDRPVMVTESGSWARELDDESLEVSFRRFVAARWGALQRYAFLLTGDHQIAEDVVQMALEKCWRRWAKIRADSPESYVRSAVANTAATRHRRRKLPETSLDEIIVQPVTGQDHAEIHAVRSGLWAGLNDLPPRQRTIVVLRLWEDRSVEETARILGITNGAVKSQLSKAVAQLRRHPQVRDVMPGLAGNGVLR